VTNISRNLVHNFYNLCCSDPVFLNSAVNTYPPLLPVATNARTATYPSSLKNCFRVLLKRRE